MNAAEDGKLHARSAMGLGKQSAILVGEKAKLIVLAMAGIGNMLMGDILTDIFVLSVMALTRLHVRSVMGRGKLLAPNVVDGER